MTQTSHTWTVEPFRDEHLAGVLRLFEEGGLRPRGEAEYRWRMLGGPCAAPTVWLAVDRGRVVGHYGGTPTPMRLAGKPMLAIHASDAVTAPDYRRQGILTAVCAAAHRAWLAAGVRLQIGLPWGLLWGSRREAVGWQPVLRMVRVRRWLRPELAVARRLGLPAAIRRGLARAPGGVASVAPAAQGGEELQVRELREAEAALDGLWTRAGDGWEHLVVRDRDWVARRYLTAPERDYRLLLAERAGEPVGYLVYRVDRHPAGDARGQIADLFGPPDEAAARRALVRAALERCREAGADAAEMLVGEGGLLLPELRAAGFRAGKSGDFCVIPLEPGGLPFEQLTRADGWHLTGGDFDLV